MAVEEMSAIAAARVVVAGRRFGVARGSDFVLRDAVGAFARDDVSVLGAIVLGLSRAALDRVTRDAFCGARLGDEPDERFIAIEPLRGQSPHLRFVDVTDGGAGKKEKKRGRQPSSTVLSVTHKIAKRG